MHFLISIFCFLVHPLHSGVLSQHLQGLLHLETCSSIYLPLQDARVLV